MLVACYLVCAIVWGTTWYAIRLCIAPGGYPTVSALALRFTIAVVVLLAVLAAGFGRPFPRSRREVVWLAIAGLWYGAEFALMYRAEESLSGGLVSVLFGTYPLMVAVAAAVTRTERIRASDVVSSLIALAGIVILFWDRLSISQAQAGGIAFALGSVLVSVGYNVVFKRVAEDVHPLASTTIFFGVSAIAMWGWSLARGLDPVPWPPPVDASLALLYLAILGSVVSWVCYFHLLKRIGLMTAGTLILVQPLMALVVDAFLEHRVELEARSWVGCGVTFGGVVLGSTWKWWVAKGPSA